MASNQIKYVGMYNIPLMVRTVWDMLSKPGTNYQYILTTQSDWGLGILDRTTLEKISTHTSIQAKRIVIPSFVSPQRLFFVKKNGSLTRNKFDYTVEVTKSSFSGTVLTFREIVGLDILLFANTASRISIIDSDLNELRYYDLSSSITTLHTFCVMDGSNYVGVGGSTSNTRGSIY